MIKNHFRLIPKEKSYMYWHPHPEWFHCVPLPNRYSMPDFSKFSRQNNVSTIENVSQFLAQCGEVAGEDALRV